MACSRSSAPPPPEPLEPVANAAPAAPPPTGRITWDARDSNNACDDHACVVHVFGAGVTLVGVPAGARLIVGDQTVVAATSEGNPHRADARASMDFSSTVATIDVARVFGRTDRSYVVELPGTVRVELPDGRSFEGSVSTYQNGLARILGASLEGVTRGEAVTYSAEGTGHAMLVFDHTPGQLDVHPRLLGDARTPGDIRRVATITYETRELSACGTYTQQGTGRQATITRTTRDATAVTYDRRTGLEHSRRVFRGATPRCQATVHGSLSDGEDREALDRWLAEQAR